ncbi:MAG TPA: thioesterase family protein [Candidatus Dormibacteraeota bacterium]
MPDSALFTTEGSGVYRPTELTRGPWSDDAQHGGPVAALLAGAVEALEPERDLQVVRLTYEFLRPIPLAPLRVEATVEGTGRSADRVSAYAREEASGRPVAVLMGLRIRRKPVGVPAQRRPRQPRGPEGLEAFAGLGGERVSFVTHGMEMRFARGSLLRPGPAAAWFRLRVPVLPGQTPSPLQRVAAACDSGNGISGLADFSTLLFINPDLNIALHRHPAGEWVCLDATSRYETNGIGGADAALFDEQGPIGRSYQTLLLAAR